MTRVNINGSNHQVEVQHEGGDLAYVIEKTRKLWDETKPEVEPPGPAYGFSAQVNLPSNHGRAGSARMWSGDRPVVDG